jgi:hypothetical protein
MVLRSRSFGFAETVSECAAVHLTRLRMARRGGGWMANREGVAMDTAPQEPLSGIDLKKRLEEKQSSKSRQLFSDCRLCVLRKRILKGSVHILSPN